MGRKSIRQAIVLSDADRAQPAEPPEARLAGPRRPGTGFGLRAGRHHSADGPVEADGPALAGPLPRPGRRRASPGRHASSGEEADPRGSGEGPDGPGDVAAPAACPAPDGAGTGREAGDGLHGILKENGLGPHRVGTFRVSRDPGFGIRARDVATGKVVGRTVDRHRSQEFLAFPDPVAEGIAPGTPVHVILDTVSSHRSARGRRAGPTGRFASPRPRRPG